MTSDSLTHFDGHGHAHMVDVGDKPPTHRIAVAEGTISMQAHTLERVLAGDHSKGDVLGIARIAGIMAAKRTSDLIPLCHPIALTRINVDLSPETESNRIRCEARIETRAPTGVEMEALTAVQIALLTIYDMCKSVDRGMSLSDIRLLRKAGGRSGEWLRPD